MFIRFQNIILNADHIIGISRQDYNDAGIVIMCINGIRYTSDFENANMASQAIDWLATVLDANP